MNAFITKEELYLVGHLDQGPTWSREEVFLRIVEPIGPASPIPPSSKMLAESHSVDHGQKSIFMTIFLDAVVKRRSPDGGLMRTSLAKLLNKRLAK